jgi:hypothetical protein
MIGFKLTWRETFTYVRKSFVDISDEKPRTERDETERVAIKLCDRRANINGVHWDGILGSVPIGFVDI